MAESRISPYSLPDLKNTTDDAVGNYMRSLSFEPVNWISDVKLALGYVSVIIAAITFVADYKLGWEATKTGTAVAVVLYFALNGVFTWWTYAVEKGLVFEGVKDGRRIALASRTKKHMPVYHLLVTTTQASGLRSTFEIRAPFTTWFTADGSFVARPFQQWLASSIAMVGDADVKNAGRDEGHEPAASNAALAASEKTVSSSAATTTGTHGQGKASKRSKRKG